MYPVSAAFLAALRKSHTAICRADLLQRGEVLASGLPVLSGDVMDDTGASVRRRASLALAPTSEVLSMLAAQPPADGGLWPLGNELKLYGGIRFRDGTEELASMGVFRINRPRVTEDPNGISAAVEGYDRGRSVTRARFTQPYTVAAGQNYSTAIQALVKSRLPWMPDGDFIFMETDFTTPMLVFSMDDDPWASAQDMAASFGAELLFDGDGRCVLRPVPDPLYTPSSFTYASGIDATVTAITRDLDDDQAYNGVIVNSSSTSLPVPIRAEVWDEDPSSPTYFDPSSPGDSLYGAVPYFMTSQYITTQEQANAAAAANLARVMGVIEAIDFQAVNNPAHEGGDIVDVKSDRIGVDATYILNSVRIGLGESFTMSGTTRRRRAS